MMKRAILLSIVALALCGSTLLASDQWVSQVVKTTTNQTTVAIDGRFTPARVLDGFDVFIASGATNTLNVSFTHASGVVGTPFYSTAHTNETLYVKDLGRVVSYGDSLVFSNSLVQTTIVLHFKME